MSKCKSCGAELAPDAKFCVECGVQVDIAQTQDQTAYQTEMQAQQNLQTDDQFEHSPYKTSAQDFPQDDEKDDDKKNINIAQRIIYYAALIISALGSLLYDILTSISFSKPKKRPTVAKVITTILIGIGDFIFLVICYLWLENLVEDKFSVSIADHANTFGYIFVMFVCLYVLYYLLLLIIIPVLNLVPTVIYIFCSRKRLFFGEAYSKCFKYFKPVIGLLCSIFAYGFLIVVSILG